MQQLTLTRGENLSSAPFLEEKHQQSLRTLAEIEDMVDLLRNLTTPSDDDGWETDPALIGIIQQVNSSGLPDNLTQNVLLDGLIGAMGSLVTPEKLVDRIYEQHERMVDNIPARLQRVLANRLKDRMNELVEQGVLQVRYGQRLVVGKDLMPALVDMSLHPDYRQPVETSPSKYQLVRTAVAIAGDNPEAEPPSGINPSTFIRTLLRHQAGLMSYQWRIAANKLAQMDDGNLVAARHAYSIILFDLQTARETTIADFNALEKIRAAIGADSRTIVVKGMELAVDIALPCIIARLVGLEFKGPMHYRVWEETISPALKKISPFIAKKVERAMGNRQEAVLTSFNIASHRYTIDAVHDLTSIIELPEMVKQKTMMDKEIAVLKDLLKLFSEEAPEQLAVKPCGKTTKKVHKMVPDDEDEDNPEEAREKVLKKSKWKHDATGSAVCDTDCELDWSSDGEM